MSLQKNSPNDLMERDRQRHNQRLKRENFTKKSAPGFQDVMIIAPQLHNQKKSIKTSFREIMEKVTGRSVGVDFITVLIGKMKTLDTALDLHNLHITECALAMNYNFLSAAINELNENSPVRARVLLMLAVDFSRIRGLVGEMLAFHERSTFEKVEKNWSGIPSFLSLFTDNDKEIGTINREAGGGVTISTKAGRNQEQNISFVSTTSNDSRKKNVVTRVRNSLHSMRSNRSLGLFNKEEDAGIEKALIELFGENSYHRTVGEDPAQCFAKIYAALEINITDCFTLAGKFYGESVPFNTDEVLLSKRDSERVQMLRTLTAAEIAGSYLFNSLKWFCTNSAEKRKSDNGTTITYLTTDIEEFNMVHELTAIDQWTAVIQSATSGMKHGYTFLSFVKPYLKRNNAITKWLLDDDVTTLPKDVSDMLDVTVVETQFKDGEEKLRAIETAKLKEAFPTAFTYTGSGTK